ncbi:MAG: ribonuclease HII [Casimicrobiaceae bacterium]|nr:ribonuclease HII [Casimicrobiaceae bacterium]MCX8098966.1 ribonuclease HII [Casimicrobiaceae bacterium]MDW8312464.1 ribonuclease HII [Burkholderiales bacterium]
MICGIDEAGRGPLAGPVFAAAVILGARGGAIAGLDDSKRLTAAMRQRLAREIRERACAWAVASASVAEIDRLNIFEATMLAMQRAFEQLLAGGSVPSAVWIDGLHRPSAVATWGQSRGVEVIARPRADAEVPAVSAASILAKTARDEHMLALDRRYPGYGFAQHKGYPTAAHLAALARLGPCAEHRMSFAPVRQRSWFA